MEWNFLFFFNSGLLGVGLAMDAFSVSMANGLHDPKMSVRRMCIIAGTFGIFQAVMPMTGWVCVHTIVELFSSFEMFIPWIALILLAGIAQYLYVQVALLDLSFAGLLKNSLMLFLGYLPRSGLGLLWQLLYWGAVALFWPISGFVLLFTSLWLPCLLSLMAIYPALEKSFDIEKKIKAIREAQLRGDDDQ